MVAENPLAYGACRIEQCSFINADTREGAEPLHRTVTALCHPVGAYLESEGLIPGDRGDLDPEVCPMQVMFGLDIPTRRSIAARFMDDLGFVTKLITGGGLQ